MQIEQLDTADGVALRSSPTPSEWQRMRMRLVAAAVTCVAVGAAVSVAELQAGLRLVLLELLPAAVGVVWGARFMQAFFRARPTAVVATACSLRLERLDGSRQENLDLSGVSAIRIGPEGFSVPWRWMKAPRDGLIVLRFRGGRGLAIPPQLAVHPVVRQLLGRMLAASRARGPVRLSGPSETVAELEQLASGQQAAGSRAAGETHIPPITIPAGWYPDPSGQAPLRWWDGREWNGYTRQTLPS